MEDKIEKANKLLRVPRKVFTDDGRELLVTKWIFSTGASGHVEVSLDAVVVEINEPDKTDGN